MVNLTVSKGNYGFYINFTIQNDDGSVFVLTGYTVTIKVWKDIQFPALLFSGTCLPVDPLAGTCRYQVANGDLSESGLFKLELELTKTGVELSTRSYDLSIRGSA